MVVYKGNDARKKTNYHVVQMKIDNFSNRRTNNIADFSKNQFLLFVKSANGGKSRKRKNVPKQGAKLRKVHKKIVRKPNVSAYTL